MKIICKKTVTKKHDSNRKWKVLTEGKRYKIGLLIFSKFLVVGIINNFKMFHRILKTAVDGGASDVHVKIATPIIFRINRQLIAIECPFPTEEWLNSIVKPSHNRATSRAMLVKSESSEGMKSFLNMISR